MAPSRFRALLVAAALAICCGGVALATGVLDGIEDHSVDARFAVRGDSRPSDVAVVAIDDVTFSDLRLRWPFPRSLYARAIRRLRAAGAREVVIDIQLTEPTEPAQDLALFDELGRGPGAVLATSETDGRGNTNVLGGDDNLAQVDSRAAAANFPDEERGVIRRFKHSVGGLETIAVAVAERLGSPVSPGDFETEGAWIDYRGGPGAIETVSFSDLLQGKADPDALRDRIVVVGVSAPTVQDVHPTSTSGDELMSGPEIQANTIWTVLHDFPLRSAPVWLDVFAILLMSLLPPLLAGRSRVLFAALAALPLAFGLAAAAQGAFELGVVLTVLPALVSLAVATVGAIVASHLAESRERRRVALANEVLEERVRERTQEVLEREFEVIYRLGQAVESRDEETGGHIERMSQLCGRLALAAGMDAEEADMVRRASAVHDVGKIGVPDSILRRAGALDEDEWEIMKAHTTMGAAMLSGSRSALIRLAETIALTHHERWDGSGYPAGLAGEEIPLVGRICAICDTFDALVSERPYKPAWPLAMA
ncbi:MAG TPA: CHASE2 domain-containing protein, partial [Thermoleophilaceae bacterium]|nr:CHASE2 domain-containing protein [Thermoleophilaceae bacterium]